MRPFGYLALILCIVLTSIGLGAARGTAMVGGQVVLCIGEAVVVVDRPDAPGRLRAHICPDMSLSLLAGTIAEAPADSDRVARAARIALRQEAALVSRATPAGIARAPPAL